MKTNIEGTSTTYTYDLAGSLLSDGENTCTCDPRNRLLAKAEADCNVSYEYVTVGNLIEETNPDSTMSYTYNAQNKLIFPATWLDFPRFLT